MEVCEKSFRNFEFGDKLIEVTYHVVGFSIISHRVLCKTIAYVIRYVSSHCVLCKTIAYVVRYVRSHHVS